MIKCPKCGSERIERDTEKGSQYERCMDCGKRIWVVSEKNTRDTELRPWQLLDEKGKSINDNTLLKEMFCDTLKTKPLFRLHGLFNCIQNSKIRNILRIKLFLFYSILFLQWKCRLGNTNNTFGFWGVSLGAP